MSKNCLVHNELGYVPNIFYRRELVAFTAEALPTVQTAVMLVQGRQASTKWIQCKDGLISLHTSSKRRFRFEMRFEIHTGIDSTSLVTIAQLL